MRVGILALLHESNTFVTQPTTMDHFRQELLVCGRQVQEQLADAHHEVSGFFEGLENEGIEPVGIFAARAIPFGPITEETFSQLTELMLDELRRAGPLDGLLVAPHGATVCRRWPDADGRWLGLVRAEVGPHVPIIGTLDAHANLSPAMVAATDALVAYRTNPHLDQRARGIEAARLMARTLRNEIRPTQAAALPPMAINIQSQETSVPPCRPLYELADQMLEQPPVLSTSILLGFPYADVAEMGSASLVVADGDRELAARCARQLGSYLWEHRREFDPPLVGIDEALDRAEQLEGPICLLDMGDNVGGGSPGDGTLLAEAMVRRRLGPALVCLCDPRAVKQAQAAGVGAELAMELGGKTDRLHGQPLAARCRVLGLYDGRFEEPEPRHGGMVRMDQGPTAVVQTEQELTVLLTSRRMPPFSLRQLTSCGLEPTRFRLLVAKGVNAPVAAYRPVCKHLIRVDTPGVTSANLRRLSYWRRRRPMFPFEGEASWSGATVTGRT